MRKPRGPGLGIVSVFDTQGNLITRVTTGGTLSAPRGLAIAPASFVPFAATESLTVRRVR